MASGATLYFIATDGSGEADIWRSDGTAAGTAPVGVAAIGPPLLFNPLAADGRGGVYYHSDTPARSSLWHTDGTAAGTRLLVAGSTDGSYPTTSLPVVLGAFAVFTTGDLNDGGGLWRTDGTPDGTVFVTAVRSEMDYWYPSAFTAIGDVALFFVSGTGDETELWRTDGTAAGTAPLAVTGGLEGTPAVTDDGRMVFNGRSYSGYRLWQSDGTEQGTFVLEYGQRANPAQLASAADRVFAIRDGGARATFGEIGCSQLLETMGSFSAFTSLAAAGDRLLFSEVLRSGAQRLWGSDGTAGGTVEVAALPPPSVAPQMVTAPRFVRAGSRVYFATRQGDSGRELWALPVAALPELDQRPCEAPPTPTPPPDRTPAPFTCPSGTRCTVLELEPVEGRAGERITVTAVLHARDLPIAGVQNDIAFPPGIAIRTDDDGDPDCVVEPSIEKPASAFAFQPPSCTPGVDCTAMRALVLSLTDVAPIYDGAVLYRCTALLSRDLEPGDHTLVLSNLGASDPDGLAVGLDGIDGVVTVEDQSGTRDIDANAGSGNGCQTAGSSTGSAAWLLAPAIGLLLRRRRNRRHR